MPVLENKAEFEKISRDIYDKIQDDDEEGMKAAAGGASDYLKLFLKEEGFLPKIVEPETKTKDDLDRSAFTDMPQMIIELEQRTPAAITVPFMATPIGLYIQANKILIQFARIQSRKLSKNVDELWTWRTDIRLLLSDQIIRDLSAEIDSTWIRSVNSILVGANAVVPYSGVAQHVTVTDSITYEGLVNTKSILAGTPQSLPTKVNLLNNLTMIEIEKNIPKEIGFTFLADTFVKGWTETEWLNQRWVVTIKKALVPTGTIYHFSDKEYLGGFYELQAPTMRIKRDDFLVSFYAHMMATAWIGNTSAVARTDFQY